MAVTEDRILVSYEINVEINTVSIVWHDRVLRDGTVISKVKHGGAYELVNGDIPDYIKQEFHISLQTFGQAAVGSLTHAKAEVEAEVQVLRQQLEDQDAAVQELVTAVQDLREQIHPTVQEAANENVT